MNKPAAAKIPLVVLILIAAFAAGLGLLAAQQYFRGPTMPQLQEAVLYPKPRDIPDFSLTRANGKPLSKADWHGHWTLVFFGYTSCPDVCPMTLGIFKQVWTALEKLGLSQQVNFDFISVDPQRDSPEQLARYIAFYSPDFIAATGSDEELVKLTRSMGQMFERTVNTNGNIEVDHSATVVIVNPKAQVVGLFRPPLSAPAMIADMQTLVGKEN